MCSCWRSSGIGRGNGRAIGGHWSQHWSCRHPAAKCNAGGSSAATEIPACRLTVLPVNVTDNDSLEQAVQAIVNMRTRHGR
jgi:NAD(P)-dependent dehydrogenase (short-subunit alcohol dehydrogenase family)